MDVASGSVTLTYTLSADDVKLGLQTCRRSITYLRVTLWIVRIAFAIGILCYAAMVLAGIVEFSWFWTGYAAVIIIVVILVNFRQKRGYARIASQLGHMSVTVDDDGLRTSTERGMAINNWTAFGRCVETRDAFVLLSPYRRPAIFTLLPKRGVDDPAEIDRLRQIFAEHLQLASR